MKKAKNTNSFNFHWRSSKIEPRPTYAHGGGLFAKRKLKQGEPVPFIPRAKFGVIVFVVVPPFRDQRTFAQAARDTPLLFRAAPTTEEWSRLHLEEVWHDRRSDRHRVATDSALALHVSGTGASIAATRRAANGLVDQIVLSHKFYRTDIGERFARQDAALLKQWGWL